MIYIALTIGPSIDVIQKMGDKQRARQTMAEGGVPVIPGSRDIIDDEGTAQEIAERVGYPVIVKATAGGGGRGLRVVHNADELVNAIDTARREAQIAFGNPSVYVEKYLDKVRHVEFQILADKHSSVVHLGERDCSIQRRKQKLLEEAPSVALTPELRSKMGSAAVKVAKTVNYTNAVTVEFLLDAKGNYYFMEKNTRIQVEHPVTEFVTGVDIVKEQIRLAAGEPLAWNESDIHINGCAIECCINAENPEKNFAPSPGTITEFHLPRHRGTC